MKEGRELKMFWPERDGVLETRILTISFFIHSVAHRIGLAVKASLHLVHLVYHTIILNTSVFYLITSIFFSFGKTSLCSFSSLYL